MKKKYVFLLGFVFLFTTLLTTTLVSASGITIPNSTGLPDPGDNVGTYTNVGPVIVVIFFFLNWLLSVFILLAVIAFVITGIQYLMAFGDYQKAETAKKNFTYSIIAVAIVGGALVIVRTIDYILS